jgi:hypothetical protein
MRKLAFTNSATHQLHPGDFNYLKQIYHEALNPQTYSDQGHQRMIFKKEIRFRINA